MREMSATIEKRRNIPTNYIKKVIIFQVLSGEKMILKVLQEKQEMELMWNKTN